MHRAYERSRGERSSQESDDQGGVGRWRSGEDEDYRRGSWYGESGYGGSSESRGERSYGGARRRARDEGEYESSEGRPRGGWSSAGESAFGEPNRGEGERRWSAGWQGERGSYRSDPWTSTGRPRGDWSEQGSRGSGDSRGGWSGQYGGPESGRESSGTGEGNFGYGYRGRTGWAGEYGHSGYGSGQGGQAYGGSGYGREPTPGTYASAGYRGSQQSGWQSGQQPYGNYPGGQQFGFGSESGYGQYRGEQAGTMPMRQHRNRGPKGYTRSDERIREDLSDRLMQGGEIDASDVEIQVQSGEVTLTGSVCTRAEKFQIEELAESIPGVKDVTNQLRVKPRDEESETQRSSSGGTTPTSGSSSMSGSESGSSGKGGGKRSGY